MNRSALYAALRRRGSGGFGASMSQQGVEAILDEGQRRGLSTEHLAAVLAESHHETGGAMQPLEENLNYSAKRLTQVWPSRFPTLAAAAPYASNPRKLANKVYGGRLGNTAVDDGWLYRGRGLAQITGKANYVKFGLGGTPDKAKDIATAIKILFDGMVDGMFTGKRLKDYDAPEGYRYATSRAIINGDVKANGGKIEALGRAFEAALREAGYSPGVVTPTPTKPATDGFLAWLGRFLLALIKGGKK